MDWLKDLREPQSEYLRERIRGLEWTDENVTHIQRLLDIERWALEGASGMADGYKSLEVRREWSEAWGAIHTELGSVWEEKHRAHKRKRQERTAEIAERKREKREKWRQWWEEHSGHDLEDETAG